MKSAVPLLLLVLGLAWGTGPVKAAAINSGRARTVSQRSVRLDDWARENQFDVRWLLPEKTLQLSNRVASLIFTVDSRQDRSKAWINGVEVSLAIPILYQNGSAFISQIDVDQTFRPVLNPVKNSPGIKIKTVCLDPGHGGKDSGFRIGFNEEKKYTLLLAQEVRDLLKVAGVNVVMTRSTDCFVPLETRPAFARQKSADLFVSLHFNSSEEARSQVKGVEIYSLTPVGVFSTNARGEGDTRWVTGNRNSERNMLLAYQVQKSILTNLAVEDRGLKRARFAVLRDATMPAILVEGGFMSHPTEGKKIFDPGYRRHMARAVADGILAYKKTVNG